MSTSTIHSYPQPGLDRLRPVGAVGTALVGVILLTYVPPSLGVESQNSTTGLLIFVSVVGLLSIAAGIAYWFRRRWGWYIHVVSLFGQFAFPGTLFELKFDMYHMIAWIVPIITLLLAALMRIVMRRNQ